MLSKPPGPLSIQQMRKKAETQGEIKSKWKHWLHDTMIENKKWLDAAQAEYKKNYDKRLIKKKEVLSEAYDVLLLIEWKNSKDHWHKLAPVAEGQFKVTTMDDKIVVLERPYRSVERVSRTRVVL